MSRSLPLPLSQQILAWLLQALGLETARSRGRRLSSGTLKGARLGKIIARSWNDLVQEVTALLGLPPVARALWPDLLRRWDAAVSAMRAPALDPGDALLLVLRMAVPRIGVRLGALAALACSASGDSKDRWEWLCDPLDPHLPRRVLEELLTLHRPEWRTWEQRYAGLAGAVDQRTIEKWNAGAILGPKVIAKIAAAVHPSVEGPLRWARAAMVLRCDLERTVGAAAVDSWRKAVRQVGTSTLATLMVPRAISLVAEFWTDEIAHASTPEVSAVVESLGRMAGVESRADDTAPWLQRVVAAGYGDRSPTRPEIHAVLLLTILQPHVRLLSAAIAHGGAQNADALASADLGRWLAGEWELMSVLRHLARGEPIERQQGSGPRATCPVPNNVRDAAGRTIEECGRFIVSRDDLPRREEDDRTLSAFLYDGTIEGLASEIAAVNMAFPIAVLDRNLERSMSEEEVGAIPDFAIARARRLAEEGDLAGTLRVIESIDLNQHSPDPHARRDLARMLIGLAHASLDPLFDAVRQWLDGCVSVDGESETLTVETLRTTIAEPIAAVMVRLDQLHKAALTWLSPEPQVAPPVEALVLSFPYLLRRERLLASLDVTDAQQPDALAIAAALDALAELDPNDGEIAAMRALSKRFDGSAPSARREADKLCEHLGTAALRDRWCTRLDRDLPLTTNAGSAGPTAEA